MFCQVWQMDCMFDIEACILIVKVGDKTMGEYKNRQQWSTATDKVLLEKFRKLSEDTRIPASRLLDEALEDLLVKYKVISKKDKRTP
jgi:hypothetical protein